MDLLSCGNRFLLFNLFLLQVETFLEITGNKFIWERLCSGRKGFSTQWKLFSFIPCFLVETGSETSSNKSSVLFINGRS